MTLLSHGTVTGPLVPLAVIEHVGVGTVTEQLSLAEPLPVHEREYVLFAVSGPEDCEPEVPVQPGGETLHDPVLVDDHAIVEEEP